MIRKEYDHGYGESWNEVCVYDHQGYGTSVSDYHEHAFYEINLVLSGKITVLLPDRVEQDCQNRVILTSPQTPHYISCHKDVFYRRLYLLFTEEFVSGTLPEWKELVSVFGERGCCLTLTEEQTETCRGIIEAIGREQDNLRRRLLTFYCLSYLKECARDRMAASDTLPKYVMESLSYIERHFAEKIVAAELAQQLYIGRTTLMMGFKKYTGMTVNEYVCRCRLRQAALLLRQGMGEQEIAERCGFCDASSMIKSFRRAYGMTPKGYAKAQSREDETNTEG